MPQFGGKTKLILQLTISFCFLYILFSQLDTQQARALLSQANVFPLFLAVFVLVVDRIWMAWKWRMLLFVFPATIRFYDAVRVYYISSFQGNLLPMGGLGPDVLRYFHLRSSALSPHAVGMSIVMERIIGILATLALATVASVILISNIGYEATAYSLIGFVLLAGTGGTVVLTGTLFNRRLQGWIYGRLSNIKVLSDHSAFPKIVDALRKYRNAPRLLAVNTVLSIIEQFFMVIAFFLAGWAFQIPLSFWDCLMVIPLSALLERLPISYAGLGIREGVQVFLLAILGVAYSDALVLTSALFIVFVISLIPGVLWSLQQRKPEAMVSPGRQ